MAKHHLKVSKVSLDRFDGLRTSGTSVLECTAMSIKTILADPGSPEVPRLEKEINEMVYALYGLTPEEIAIVEGKR